MAKSTRSKVKRSFRSKKRETGIYAATEAARLNRLNTKLISVASKDKDGDVSLMDSEGDIPGQGNIDSMGDEAASADIKSGKTKPISTHGHRGSRREEWRTAKGLAPRPSPQGMNRQGGIAARRKAGRSKRRR
ncbi:hypothetical protein BD779DRAFT_1490030 [Infundibulicybe gibba]|nr:hypothetical protein BD779DRAFT_1490030 [Infundibulicybe gibba]